MVGRVSGNSKVPWMPRLLEHPALGKIVVWWVVLGTVAEVVAYHFMATGMSTRYFCRLSNSQTPLQAGWAKGWRPGLSCSLTGASRGGALSS